MAHDYKSKVDTWLAAVMVLPWIGVGFAWWQALTMDDGLVWVAIAASALLVFVYAGLIFPMRYRIGGDGVAVRAGLLIRLHVPWDRVIGAQFTNNPLSSPALSLRRLRIEFRKANGRDSAVMISPTDRAQFLRDMAAASGRHQVDGDRLVATKPS